MTIFDTSGNQMAIYISSSHNVCFCIIWGNATNATSVEIKKTINKFHHCRHVGPNSPDHSPFNNVCSAMQSNFMGHCLRISMNSRNEWLKSGAERYCHCSQWMENASPCLCLHKWLIFKIFTVSSCTTGQLDKRSAKVLEICAKYAKGTLFESLNDTALIKNQYFACSFFPW